MENTAQVWDSNEYQGGVFNYINNSMTKLYIEIRTGFQKLGKHLTRDTKDITGLLDTPIITKTQIKK
ncbi:MAG: hypothetical protein WCX82_04840 [archaeon]|jgi:hypothetical protein